MTRALFAIAATLALAFGAAVHAQEEGGLRLAPSSDLGSRGSADYISTGAAPISIRSQSLPPQQSIRIDAGQRVEVSPGGAQQGPGQAGQPGQPPEDPALNRSRTEFQQLIYKTRGKDIEHFGLNLFGPAPATFTIADRTAPPANYIIAPGDEIRVRAWGQVDIDFAATVERSGALYIPIVGAVQVAGVPFQDLKALVRARLARQFRNFDLEVTLGQIHMAQVYVTGRAAKPGAYTIGGLSSLVNAVFAVGGPSENGSLRAIQLKRNNAVVAELDLYDFILRGDKSRDARLQSGDVIHFPPVAGYAAIAGSVQQSAIYEITPRTTFGELLELAGGLSTTAKGGRVIVERIENRQSRVVAEFTTDPSQAKRPVQDGDVVQVNPISPRFDNEVTVRGHVPETLRLPFAAGMRVSDVVPGQMALLAHQYWQLRNEKGRGFHWLQDRMPVAARPAANSADVPGRLASTTTAARAHGENGALSTRGDGVAALARMPQDTDPRDDIPRSRAPSPTAPARPDLLDELERGRQDVYWEYATIERFDRATLRTVLIPFNLARAIVERDPEENKALQPGDVVTVFSQRDIRVPVERQAQYIRIEGEVARPGIYPIAYGQTLGATIAQAGGLTTHAFVFGSELLREETRAQQQQELDAFVDRLGESLERSASTRLRESLDGGGAGAPDASAALLDAQRRLVRKLRGIRASGRVLLDAEAVAEPGAARADKLDVALQDGDRLYIPARPSTVIVLGSVNRPNAMVYRPGRTVQDYLAMAGGLTREASREILLARANGSVHSIDGSGWLSGGGAVLPGDTILVLENTEVFTGRRVLRDWTQIIYQGSLGVAGLRLLSDVFKK